MTVAAGAPSVKVGTPTNDELEELAFAIEESWKKLGRRLGVSDAALTGIAKENELLSERAYHMLSKWKNDRGSAASYKVLNGALRHKFVERHDLAERFCEGGIKRRELMTVRSVTPSVKVGKPTEDELYRLGFAMEDSWRKLGHCLGVSEAVLDDIDQDFAMASKKGYHMLIHWKRGATASYKVLNDALRHEDVQRQDLAKKFCQG